MAPRRVVFLGGNGHCSARLALARPALGDLGPDLVDVRYPGFEGRAGAPDLETFLRRVTEEVAAAATGPRTILYATGIGGLVALCLRARGTAGHHALVLQAPVLWGLEQRLMPRLMRLRTAQCMVPHVFAWRLFQGRFVRRHFMRPLPAQLQRAFFEGYGRCSALADMFRWFTPPVLRQIERDMAGRPQALRDIVVWWGGRDRVVTAGELARTENALGVKWPLRVFPDWGHYPMIDDPEGWARALRET